MTDPVTDTEVYPAFRKIPRANRTWLVTEKLDGTNGLISVRELDDPNSAAGTVVAVGDGETSVVWYDVRAGSRKRWITPESDNYGFAAWVYDNAVTLVNDLGTGNHYGEWYGHRIQRGYDLDHRRFALFNWTKFNSYTLDPETGRVDKTLKQFETPNLETTYLLGVGETFYGTADAVDIILDYMDRRGSVHHPGYMRPEGVVLYHEASGNLYKVLTENDHLPKG